MFSAGDKPSSAPSGKRPQGLYMYGGVGVGESSAELHTLCAAERTLSASRCKSLLVAGSWKNIMHWHRAGKTMLMDLLVQSALPEFKVCRFLSYLPARFQALAPSCDVV
jgi:predicted ATPase